MKHCTSMGFENSAWHERKSLLERSAIAASACVFCSAHWTKNGDEEGETGPLLSKYNTSSSPSIVLRRYPLQPIARQRRGKRSERLLEKNGVLCRTCSHGHKGCAVAAIHGGTRCTGQTQFLHRTSSRMRPLHCATTTLVCKYIYI
jgi:hypothetical protein